MGVGDGLEVADGDCEGDAPGVIDAVSVVLVQAAATTASPTTTTCSRCTKALDEFDRSVVSEAPQVQLFSETRIVTSFEAMVVAHCDWSIRTIETSAK